MAAHFHLCEQCGEQYVCDQNAAVCANSLCLDCAERAATAAYEFEHYDRLRAADEQRGRAKPNSYIRRRRSVDEFDNVRRG